MNDTPISDSVSRLDEVNAAIHEAAVRNGRAADAVSLIAVSKTFPREDILPLLKAGHRRFGENKVQEAQAKWPSLRSEYPDAELHLIGPLQSNKAADAVALFDVIQTIDRPKIADVVSREMRRQNRAVRLLVQVNIGREPQKSGIEPEDTLDFLRLCEDEHGLTVEGLMCIPPADQDPVPYFRQLAEIASQSHLSVLSMGMSGDYPSAIAEGATWVRVGSAIFGNRPALRHDHVG